MNHSHSVILINSRIVLRAYAFAAALGGMALSLFGPLWLGPEFRNRTPYDESTAKLLALALVAGSVLAATLAGAPDSRRRRRGLLWLAIAHAVIVVAVMVLHPSTMHRGSGGLLVGLLLSAAVLPFYAWGNADGHRLGESVTPTRLFGAQEDAAVEPMRSRYEQEIRLAASQEERNRLARDLHDSVKQQIFVVQTAAATAQTRFDNDPAGAKAAIEDVRRAAREAMAEMDAMLDGLSATPIETSGLVEALRKQCDAIGFRTGARVDCEVGPLPPSESLPPGTPHAIFRVAQEALANVGRHARAGHVRVSLTHAGDTLELVVQDDGSGFERGVRAGGLGLDNMRERAREVRGDVEVVTKPGSGTTVRLTVPASPFPRDAWRGHRSQMILWGSITLGYLVLRLSIPSIPRTLAESPGGLAIVLINSTMFTAETIAYFRTRPRRGTRA